MGQLDGKVTIVTGSNKGIGKQVAIKYAEEGAIVVLASIDMEPYKLQDVADTIKASGAEVLAIHCDITKEEDIKSTVKKTVEKYGRVDIVANIAQAYLHNMDSIETMTAEAAVNMFKGGPLAYALFIQECAPYMKKQKFGRIINFSSGMAFGYSNCLSYGMAKGAVISLTRCAAYDLGKYNITINTIVPACQTGESLSPHHEEHIKALNETVKRMPNGYMGKPYENIAPTCVFLATDGCGYLQGQLLALDGGLTMTK
jgi:NAD(P)-dependent dehydrogenase (short-subunit alcohol dehydrogenase family)